MPERIAVLALAGVLACGGFAGADGAAAKPSLEDLAWLAGTYRGEAFGGAIEEWWAPPLGGSVIGLVRLTDAGKTTSVEMLIIAEEADGIVLRLRHFGARYEPREDAPTLMHLVEVAPGRVVFRSDDAGSRIKHLTYRRPNAKDFLIDVTRTGDERFQLRLSAD